MVVFLNQIPVIHKTTIKKLIILLIFCILFPLLPGAM